MPYVIIRQNTYNFLFTFNRNYVPISQAAQSRQPCVNSHQLSQWEPVIFDHPQNRRPLIVLISDMAIYLLKVSNFCLLHSAPLLRMTNSSFNRNKKIFVTRKLETVAYRTDLFVRSQVFGHFDTIPTYKRLDITYHVTIAYRVKIRSKGTVHSGLGCHRSCQPFTIKMIKLIK